MLGDGVSGGCGIMLGDGGWGMMVGGWVEDVV